MALVQQRIEDVRTLAGRTVTISFKGAPRWTTSASAWSCSSPTERVGLPRATASAPGRARYAVAMAPGHRGSSRLAGKTLGPDSCLHWASGWTQVPISAAARSPPGRRAAACNWPKCRSKKAITATDSTAGPKHWSCCVPALLRTVDVNRIIGITYTRQRRHASVHPVQGAQTLSTQNLLAVHRAEPGGLRQCRQPGQLRRRAPSWQSTVDAAVIASMPNNMQLWARWWCGRPLAGAGPGRCGALTMTTPAPQAPKHACFTTTASLAPRPPTSSYRAARNGTPCHLLFPMPHRRTPHDHRRCPAA